MFRRGILGLANVAFILWASTASGQNTTPVPHGENLRGHRGLLRTMSAHNQTKGFFSLGGNLEFFTANEFLPAPGGAGEDAKADHSRLATTVNLAWAPLSFLEAALAINVVSDNSSVGDADELQVTVGDPQLSVKGGYEVLSGLAFGGLLDARWLTGTGYLQAGSSSFTLTMAALGSWKVSSKLPLSVHLNVGYIVDQSEALFDDPSQLTPSQQFAAQLSSFGRVLTRVGVEYVTQYVGPFIEFSMEPFVGSGAPSFGDSPTRLSFGAQAWPGKKKGLQLLAALDIGLTGVGNGEPRDLDAGKYAFVIPRWNLALRASYRFDPFYEPPATHSGPASSPLAASVQAPTAAAIVGKVIDSQTLKPIWNARVKLEGDSPSALAVNPEDGSFTTYDVSLGTRTVVASAEGYLDTRVVLDVDKTGAKTVIQLSPKVSFRPGTIRGTVTARGGRRVAGATVLIPSLDQSATVGQDGTFEMSLKPGQVKIVVSAPGLRPQEKSIRVVEGSTVILNVELYK